MAAFSISKHKSSLGITIIQLVASMSFRMRIGNMIESVACNHFIGSNQELWGLNHQIRCVDIVDNEFPMEHAVRSPKRNGWTPCGHSQQNQTRNDSLSMAWFLGKFSCTSHVSTTKKWVVNHRSWIFSDLILTWYRRSGLLCFSRKKINKFLYFFTGKVNQIMKVRILKLGYIWPIHHPLIGW